MIGDIRHIAMWGVLIALTVLLTGCGANLHTVGRATGIPSMDGKKGIAIHLDAQQRVVLSTANGFCAEPSPDAFSAYAASFGLGAATPNKDSLSVAKALQSMSGSLGLRTQSITLMRDALYRMCEASNNGNLEKWEIASFLRRSQDLTAVVLAIEQLTGAVAGNQVILLPDGRADTSASLLSNQELLDQAEEKVRVAQKGVNAAEDKLRKIRESVKQETNDGTEPSQNPTVKEAEDDLDFAHQRLNGAVEVRDRIRESRDAVMVDVRLESGSSGRFVPATQTRSLSPEATREIARAVTAMVAKVLDKDYRRELCLSYMTGVAPHIESSKPWAAARVLSTMAFCRDLLRKSTEDGNGSSDETGSGAGTQPEEGEATPQPSYPLVPSISE